MTGTPLQEAEALPPEQCIWSPAPQRLRPQCPLCGETCPTGASLAISHIRRSSTCADRWHFLKDAGPRVSVLLSAGSAEPGLQPGSSSPGAS